jgi:hypothetical protein
MINSAPNGNSTNAVVTVTAAATKVCTIANSQFHPFVICLTALKTLSKDYQ